MIKKELINQLNTEVADFFEMKPLEIHVRVLKSREEIDEIKSHKTKDWVIGFTHNEVVYILDKEKWETQSCHPKSQFEGALKHEIAHIYWKKIKDNNLPSWLSEGTAEVAAGQDFLCNYPEEITISKLDSFHSYNPDKGSHEIGGTMVSKIVKEYGKEKLFELIKMGDREKRYTELKNMFKWLS